VGRKKFEGGLTHPKAPSMDHGQRAASGRRKNAQAPSRADQQAGREDRPGYLLTYYGVAAPRNGRREIGDPWQTRGPRGYKNDYVTRYSSRGTVRHEVLTRFARNKRTLTLITLRSSYIDV